MKNLENYGVVSLENKEMMEIDGGFILSAICVGLAVAYLYSQTMALYMNGECDF